MNTDTPDKYFSTEQNITLRISPVIAERIGLRPAMLLSLLIRCLDKAREYENGLPPDNIKGLFTYHFEGRVWLRIKIHELASELRFFQDSTVSNLLKWLITHGLVSSSNFGSKRKDIRWYTIHFKNINAIIEEEERYQKEFLEVQEYMRQDLLERLQRGYRYE